MANGGPLLISVQISTDERYSPRFTRLCERLDHHQTWAKQMRVWGHLALWYTAWAGNGETDSGLLWNLTESDLGRLAEWPECLKFGRALVSAGYVQPIEERFTHPLLTKGRRGFVVVSADGEIALDKSWGWHKNRARKEENCLFLTDRAQRAHYAKTFGVNPAAAPAGWLDVSHAGYAPPDIGPPGGYPHQHAEPPGGAPPPPSSPYVNVRKEPNLIRRNEGNRTGKPKSWELFHALRRAKSGDLFEALTMTDDGPEAVRLAREIVTKDPSFAHTVLSTITETEAAWAQIRSTPAAVIFSSIRTRLASTKRSRTQQTNHPEEGGGGALRLLGGKAS